MRLAVYIVGGLATFLALVAAVLAVLLALTLLSSVASSDRWMGWVCLAVALVHLAAPIVGIVLARRAHEGIGLALVCGSLLVSLGLLALLPGAIGAAAQ